MSQLQDNLNEILRQKNTYLLPTNLRKNITVLGITGSYEGIDTSDANATAADIKSGKTAYVDGIKVTGSATIAGHDSVKLFPTVTAMNNDNDKVLNDIAIVYNSTITGVMSALQNSVPVDGYDLTIPTSFTIPHPLSSGQSNEAELNPGDDGDLFLNISSTGAYLLYNDMWGGYAEVNYSVSNNVYTASASDIASLKNYLNGKSITYTNPAKTGDELENLDAMMQVNIITYNGLYEYNGSAYAALPMGALDENSASPANVLSGKKFIANNQIQTGTYVAPTKANAFNTVYGLPSPNAVNASMSVIVGSRSIGYLPIYGTGLNNGDIIGMEVDNDTSTLVGHQYERKIYDGTTIQNVSTLKEQSDLILDVLTKEPYLVFSYKDTSNNNHIYVRNMVTNTSYTIDNITINASKLTVYNGKVYVYDTTNKAIKEIVLGTTSTVTTIGTMADTYAHIIGATSTEILFISQSDLKKLKKMDISTGTVTVVDDAGTVLCDGDFYITPVKNGILYKSIRTNVNYISYYDYATGEITNMEASTSYNTFYRNGYEINVYYKDNKYYLYDKIVNLSTETVSAFTGGDYGANVIVNGECKKLVVSDGVCSLKDENNVSTQIFNGASFGDTNAYAEVLERPHTLVYNSDTKMYMKRVIIPALDSATHTVKLYISYYDIFGLKHYIASQITETLLANRNIFYGMVCKSNMGMGESIENICTFTNIMYPIMITIPGIDTSISGISAATTTSETILGNQQNSGQSGHLHSGE